MDNMNIGGLMNSMLYYMQRMQPPSFEDIDTNQDSSIDKAEFQSSVENLPHPGPARDVDQIFSEIDTDVDDLISQQELQAAGERHQANMGGMKPAGGPPPGGAPGAGPSGMPGSEEEDEDSLGVYYDPLDTNEDGIVDMSELIAAGLIGPSKTLHYGSYPPSSEGSQTEGSTIDLIG